MYNSVSDNERAGEYEKVTRNLGLCHCFLWLSHNPESPKTLHDCCVACDCVTEPPWPREGAQSPGLVDKDWQERAGQPDSQVREAKAMSLCWVGASLGAAHACSRVPESEGDHTSGTELLYLRVSSLTFW